MAISLPVFVRARSFMGFGDLVTRLGGDPAAMLAAAGLEPEFLNRPDAIVPFAQAAALLDHAAEMLDLPDVGLQLGAYQDISYGPVALVAQHAANVREALEVVGRYLASYHSPGSKMTLHVDAPAGTAQLRWALRSEAGMPSRHVFELTCLLTVKILRAITRNDGADWQISFRHAPGLVLDRYRTAFGCAVDFRQLFDGVGFPSRLLDGAIDLANDDLRRNAERYVANVVRRFPLDIGSQVAALVDRQLGAAACSLVQIARQLGLHERTLQRRLSEQGLRFEEIVDRLRRERAGEFLTNAAIPLTQVAGMLGYSEHTVFTRACWRWFGESPRAIRQRGLRESKGQSQAWRGESQR